MEYSRRENLYQVSQLIVITHRPASMQRLSSNKSKILNVYRNTFNFTFSAFSLDTTSTY